MFLDDSVAVLESDRLTMLDISNGSMRWSVDLAASLPRLLEEHREIHVLTEAGRLLHYDLDGSLIFDGAHASDRTFTAFDHRLIVETNGMRITAFTTLEQSTWTIDTGLDPGHWITIVHIVEGSIVTQTAAPSAG